VRRLLVAGLAFLLAVACTGGTTTTPAPSQGPVGGTLRLGMGNVSYWSMDPRDEWNSATWELLRCCLVRTLMSYDPGAQGAELVPVPDLAAGPPEISSDGQEWTFRLREGLRYAPPLEDVEITSGDIVRAITRAASNLDPVQGGLPGYLDMIDGFDAYVSGDATSIVGLQTPDPHTLRIRTTRMDVTLLYILTLPMTAPIPPMPGSEDAPFGVATGYDDPEPFGGTDTYGAVLVASGPYMYEGAGEVDFTVPPHRRTPPTGFTAWEVDDDFQVTKDGSITLVRNPSWHPEDDPIRVALADRIEIDGGPPEDLFPMMESGALDLVFDSDPPRSLLRTYQDDPELRPLIQTPIGSALVILASFNVARPPFDDLAVRRAVAFAMDRLPLAELFVGPTTRVAEHFAVDTFEASLLASWSAFPGADGRGDQAAARDAMRASSYATGDRCTDRSCDDVQIVIRDSMEPGVPALRAALLDLGITARFRLSEWPYDCLDPESKAAMCIGMGWAPDFPSGSQFIGAFFAREGPAAATRLGSTPAELRRWGYDVTHVPSLDREIERCEREIGTAQAPCWARLDQYVATRLMPAVPMGFLETIRLSSPAIGPFPWNQIYLVPALDRIAAPTRPA